MKADLRVNDKEEDWERWFEPDKNPILPKPSITNAFWSALEELPFPHLSYEKTSAVVWQ
jgi:hypothetical protein